MKMLAGASDVDNGVTATLSVAVVTYSGVGGVDVRMRGRASPRRWLDLTRPARLNKLVG